MKVGFSLPQYGGQASGGAHIARFARELEQAGADSLWVGDRLLAAVNPSVGYGGRPTIPAQFNAVLDPFAVLAVAAGVTERVRLGTNVLIAPLYPPAILARMLTTLDVVSAGRLVPGLGIGWSPEEYAAAGIPFSHRGARFDETLDALQAIWGADRAEYRGAWVTVPDHHTELATVQRPHPPIHLGAFSAAGIARIGRRADGWLPVLMVPGPPEQPAGLLRQRRAIDESAERAGRDPGAIATIVRVNAAADSTPQAIADAVRRLVDETGFDDLFIDPLYLADSVDDALELALQLLKLLA
ncbi:TIGR03619 family F420-dependent LLM class oxidoreductase [Nocardia sp. NEAU-G5]|uniref:TIGR03619 family F420-dependent LLM class oxidoreductase n=1 Tax=Nocardia albiluteola TaxID=2842303 RepID=A0ABS6B7S9_9NOCA|nr:TIGR03619 family F420-dependent LLM class oxidoreductase [Nocardia albiluteola]MBU3066372.1 TIGR03619 family F420-dependent LLM class oxidoreductase [Nocardia albiluteola]